jgi:alpha-glucosidase
MKEALDTYEQWGVAGIKVDFMQRDDQKAVDFYWRTAKEAAKRKMLVNFHGSYKPTGIRRAYPNVITREGVRGLEQNKFGNLQTPEQDLMIPFIRMAVGPVDYTPGAMRNAQDHSFNPVFKRPMSQGTRAHQVAMYGIYESPLQMLSDSPSNYLNEKETTEFISKFPTTWDETIPLQAKVGEYIAVAKRSGSKYFLSAMTGKRSRKFSIDLSFLQPGKKYNVVIYRDGYNSDLFAEDYILEKKTVSNTDNVLIEMSKGGGYSARFEPLSK